MIDVILTGKMACDHMGMAVAGDHDGRNMAECDISEVTKIEHTQGHKSPEVSCCIHRAVVSAGDPKTRQLGPGPGGQGVFCMACMALHEREVEPAATEPCVCVVRVFPLGGCVCGLV